MTRNFFPSVSRMRRIRSRAEGAEGGRGAEAKTHRVRCHRVTDGPVCPSKAYLVPTNPAPPCLLAIAISSSVAQRTNERTNERTRPISRRGMEQRRANHAAENPHRGFLLFLSPRAIDRINLPTIEISPSVEGSNF